MGAIQNPSCTKTEIKNTDMGKCVWKQREREREREGEREREKESETKE